MIFLTATVTYCTTLKTATTITTTTTTAAATATIVASSLFVFYSLWRAKKGQTKESRLERVDL